MATLSGSYTAMVSATPLLRKNVLIKCPENPSLNADIPVVDDWLKIKKGKRRAIKRPVGRSLPIVLRGVEEGDTLSMTFLCIATDYNKLMALVDAERTLLVQNEKEQWYVEVQDDASIEEHLWDGVEDDAWQVTVPFVEVAMP